MRKAHGFLLLVNSPMAMRWGNADAQACIAGRCDPLNDSNYAWASGTSMAVPHVAAAAAIYLSQTPKASPATVAQAVAGASSNGVLSTQGMLPGTPNKLLFIDRSVI